MTHFVLPFDHAPPSLTMKIWRQKCSWAGQTSYDAMSPLHCAALTSSTSWPMTCP